MLNYDTYKRFKISLDFLLKFKYGSGLRNSPVSTGFSLDEQGNIEDPTNTAAVMENTYQLGPSKQFPVSAVSDILKEETNNNLQEVKYEAQRCRELTLTLCEGIRNRVKELLIPRYKTVVLVHIGQLNGQGMQISSRCLWDPSSDTFTSYSFKNSSLFCSATVFGVYFE
ncbi:dynein light chain Tctex-type 5-B-like isoform X1 [Girardinichthys multiradiatus]|nr:dynein light chain Tctex-type 5-B-like isoform X1 [Girardinichthys multiradiatus]XP_047224463.1 dynein light chain Tctex-type 5-B-like isoform X1 [Girardinichthys multiradiatus]XP_047224464.1 dynein light chain Tctex-type 5-B-like isoform X1 [Girardinichthys multiradiatus]